MKKGHIPTVEEWSRLKSEGWTVESWNAEMDSRRSVNAQNRWLSIIFIPLIVAFFYVTIFR